MMEWNEWIASFRAHFASESAFLLAQETYPCEIAWANGILPRAAFEEYCDGLATQSATC